MSIDLLLDENVNDIIFVDGLPKLVSNNVEAARQRLLIRFQTWMGSWFMNTNFGMPYRQQILKKGVDKDALDALFINEANKIEIVDQVVRFETSITNRVYSGTIEVRVTPATINNIQVTRQDEWIYPTPPDDILPNVGGSDDYLELANELYALINFDLPVDGTSTWWNLWSPKLPS